MKSKALTFDIHNAADVDLFSKLVASYQYHGVKFHVERDGYNVVLITE